MLFFLEKGVLLIVRLFSPGSAGPWIAHVIITVQVPRCHIVFFCYPISTSLDAFFLYTFRSKSYMSLEMPQESQKIYER